MGSESLAERCRQCQSARSGDGYGEVPPPEGYDDRCDECAIGRDLRSGSVAFTAASFDPSVKLRWIGGKAPDPEELKQVPLVWNPDAQRSYDNFIAERDRKRTEAMERELEAARAVVELAGCLTNMDLVYAVHYRATHPTLRMDAAGGIEPIEDPVARQYQLVEDQFIPVFKLLKNAVADYREERRKNG